MKESRLSNAMRVVLGLQLLFALALLKIFGGAQWSILRYQLFAEPALFHLRVLPAALFCIAAPLATVIASLYALCGRRWAIRTSLVLQCVIALAAAAFCVPELFYMFRGIDRGWAGPWFFMASAPIFIIAIVFAIILCRHVAKSSFTANA